MIEATPAAAMVPARKIVSARFTHNTRRTCVIPGASLQRLERFGEASDLASAELARRPGISPLTERRRRARTTSNSQHLTALLDVADALGLGHLLTVQNAQNETRQGMPSHVDIDLETRAIVIFWATASNLLQAASYGKRVALAETGDRLSGTPSISNSLTPSNSVRPGSEILSPRNTNASRRFSRSRTQSGLSPYAHVALVSFGSH